MFKYLHFKRSKHKNKHSYVSTILRPNLGSNPERQPLKSMSLTMAIHDVVLFLLLKYLYYLFKNIIYFSQYRRKTAIRILNCFGMVKFCAGNSISWEFCHIKNFARTFQINSMKHKIYTSRCFYVKTTVQVHINNKPRLNIFLRMMIIVQ